MPESPEKTAGPIQAKAADDLKSREYRDSAGNVHHHTRRYMEQHKETR